MKPVVAAFVQLQTTHLQGVQDGQLIARMLGETCGTVGPPFEIVDYYRNRGPGVVKGGLMKPLGEPILPRRDICKRACFQKPFPDALLPAPSRDWQQHEFCSDGNVA